MPIFHVQTHPDSECVQILKNTKEHWNRKNIQKKNHKKRVGKIQQSLNCYTQSDVYVQKFFITFEMHSPFSKLSIWSLVKEVRFLWSFLLSLKRAWSSSGPPTIEPGFELSPPEVHVSSDGVPSKSNTVTKNTKKKIIRDVVFLWGSSNYNMMLEECKLFEYVQELLCFTTYKEATLGCSKNVRLHFYPSIEAMNP